ncbi:MAG: tetratricopeptide repeat protein [Ferruginibacter sp.]
MNPEIIDKIEQYLNDEMQPQERTDFERELQNDNELKNNFDLYNSINNTMKAEEVSEDENELAKTLQQLNRKYILPGSRVKQGNFRKWMAAAAAVLILIFGSIYFFSGKNMSSEKLYASYAQHAPVKIQLRGTTTDSLAGMAADKFNNKQYAEALPLLQQYVKLQPDDIQMIFSLGICYLETNGFNDAEKTFSAIAAGQTAYTETATWYLALTALKQKDISKCRIILKSIPQTSAWFAKAKELLEKLPG